MIYSTHRRCPVGGELLYQFGIWSGSVERSNDDLFATPFRHIHLVYKINTKSHRVHLNAIAYDPIKCLSFHSVPFQASSSVDLKLNDVNLLAGSKAVYP